jgi:hypothetical protein
MPAARQRAPAMRDAAEIERALARSLSAEKLGDVAQLLGLMILSN